MPRRRGKVDANQTEIANVFRDHGASVAFTSNVGDGFPDIVVGYQGVNILVEIKDGKKPPSKRALTSDQVKFRDNWRGMYVVIESVNDALELLKSITEHTRNQFRG